jgi:hypothetical protein
LVGAACAAAVPVTRWAIGRGVPSIANRVGETALERLALPAGTAPETDGALAAIAERLRRATGPSTRSFRLLLADYSETHVFGFPPSTVIVTAGMVCAAKDPDAVMASVAEELAHLENHDAAQRVAQTADWHTALDLARGDVGPLSTRMLDFADPKRCPGYTPEQEKAAKLRAGVILAATALPIANEDGSRAPAIHWELDWSKVRAEACDLVGR